MNLTDRLDSIQVIDSRVEPDLIHYDNPGFLSLFIKLPDRRRDVASRDDVRLALDGCLDHGGVVRVGDEGDNKIVICDCTLEVRR